MKVSQWFQNQSQSFNRSIYTVIHKSASVALHQALLFEDQYHSQLFNEITIESPRPKMASSSSSTAPVVANGAGPPTPAKSTDASTAASTPNAADYELRVERSQNLLEKSAGASKDLKKAAEEASKVVDELEPCLQ